VLRKLIHDRFNFDPGRAHGWDAVVQLCLEHQFDPVVEYLERLKWDGRPRLEQWLATYMNAQDSELNREIGEIMLVAAVRRARDPGCKYDTIPVLEGSEGTNKSTAISILAGPENFSDQTILGLRDKEQQELLRGVWVYEIADLHGFRRAEVDAVKAFASRTADRCRPAYGRSVVNQPRRCVFIGTTNEESYLKSVTGNRRFWPVRTGEIDIAALRRDRDQLWAEAAVLEATGMSLVLPERLWGTARVEQDERLEDDPWLDVLADVTGKIFPASDGPREEERITNNELYQCLSLPADRNSQVTLKRLKGVMRRLGWNGPKKWKDAGRSKRGYWRDAGTPSAEE
jgi:predicted P-loop ATPase